MDLLSFWKKTKKPDEESLQLLVDILEKGDKAEIEKLLWHPKGSTIEYLPITFDLILKLKRPGLSAEKLSIYKLVLSKNYTLIFFNTPWASHDLGFLPLIIETSTSQIVGIMLPFNELHTVLSTKQHKEISKLGAAWTMFAMSKRFGLKME